jgi:3-oxoacyl-[acyl-carrier-protein] synthase-3
MYHSRIIGTGSYLPSKILTNSDLEKIVNTSDAWIIERTGISERRVMAKDETVASMAEQAARQAIAAANINPQDLDLIIVATCTAGQSMPSAACLLQKLLGAGNCPAFDLNAACSGFIYGLSIAEQYTRSGAARTVLVVGSDALTRIVDWQDRSTCILFGDGAGAVVLQASPEPGILGTHMYADGNKWETLYTTPNLDSAQPCYIKMQGNTLYKIAIQTLSSLVEEMLAKYQINQSEIKWLVPHQANLRIIQATAKALGISMDKVIITLNQQGNTTAASIPLALDTAVRESRIQRGDIILLEAFGAGLTWGASLIQY